MGQRKLNSYETIPKLTQALSVRFSNADVDKCSGWAEEIYDAFRLSQSLEILDASDRTSERDIISLTKAIRQLRLAVTSLEEIGWHGGKALQASATQYLSEVSPFAYDVGILEASSVYSEQVEAIADILESAINSIPQNAPSVNTAFGEGPGFERSTTKPKKPSAKRVASTCATAFQDLSGVRPTVATRIYDSTAYGQFLDCVTEVFDLLGIQASPETWARSAVAKVKGS